MREQEAVGRGGWAGSLRGRSLRTRCFGGFEQGGWFARWLCLVWWER